MQITPEFDRFTSAAKNVVLDAQKVAERLKAVAGTESLLIALVRAPGIPSSVLVEFGIDEPTAHAKAAAMIDERDEGFTPSPIPFTQAAKHVLDVAYRQMLQLGTNHVEPEHILLALLVVEGLARDILEALGVNLDELRSAAINQVPPL